VLHEDCRISLRACPTLGCRGVVREVQWERILGAFVLFAVVVVSIWMINDALSPTGRTSPFSGWCAGSRGGFVPPDGTPETARFDQRVDEGVKNLSSGSYAAAVTAFTEALDLDGTSSRAWYAYVDRSIAFGALKRGDEALADANRAIDIDPNRPESWVYRGYALEAQVHPWRALADYKLAAEKLEPGTPLRAWCEGRVAALEH
jgi:tetratricopeptide (TPR) repeat protein